ncbi:MAG: hypothetical protein HN509_02005 [Halobacteriovoraceae bacterium]|jgi:hypothetical protein|nr:hypothetical protein [Halobacteriovoraceae bacterium]MBT5092629.1 hypothetical protein [Halobacteriovoraceae bacterium]
MSDREKKRRSFDLNIMQEHAAKLGGKCLSVEYKNSTYRLLFECEKGHKWRATPLEIMGKKSKTGSWCPQCKS